MKLIAFLLLLLVAFVDALYEDQANEFDWLKKHIGRVEQIVSPRTSLKHGFVRSRQNVLAKISLKKGQILWRHVFAQDDPINHIVLTPTSSHVLSISGHGKMVRKWDAADGGLLWELPLYSSERDVGKHHQLVNEAMIAVLERSNTEQKNPVLVVSTGMDVFRIDTEAGTTLKRFKLPRVMREITSLLINSNALYLLGTDDTQKKSVFQINKGDGVVEKRELDIDPVAEYVFFHHAPIVKKVYLASFSLSKQEFSFQAIESDDKVVLSAKSLLSSAKIVSIDTRKQHYITAVFANGATTLANFDGKSMHVLHSFRHSVVISEERELANGSVYIAVASSQTKDGKKVMETQLIYMNEIVDVMQTAVVGNSAGKDISSIFVQVNEPKLKKNNNYYRLLMVLRDDSFLLVKKSQVAWLREESLASITQAFWVTPTDITETQIPKKFPHVGQHLLQQLKKVRQFPTSLMDSLKLVSTFFSQTDLTTATVSNHLLQRPKATLADSGKNHFFGFCKYIVILTKSGVLHAIDAMSGSIHWSKFYGDLSGLNLIVTRDHPALDAGAELLLMSYNKAIYLDADTGNVIREIPLQFNGAKSKTYLFLLPFHHHHLQEEETKDSSTSTSSFKRTVALVTLLPEAQQNQQNKVKVNFLSSSSSTTSSTKEEREKLANHFHFHLCRDKKSWHGYRLKYTEEEGWVAVETWSLVLTEPIVAVYPRSGEQRGQIIDSSVEITHDDSLLLKYLNPHLISFATLNSETHQLLVYLLDTVSGKIVYSNFHDHAVGPVHIVQSENWCIYSYHNSKSKRVEMGSLSLFEGAVGSHGLNPWKRPAWSSHQSSFVDKPPIVLQQAFILPSAAVTSLGVTQTANGITPQHILIGLASGQLAQLPRRLLDPRRPLEAIKQEQAEAGLLQYQPHLPIWQHAPNVIVSSNKSIEMLHGRNQQVSISSTSVTLESTSLVMVYGGLDFYFTRITPMKAFDLLPSDFKYSLLVCLVTTIFIAMMVARSFVQRKKRNDAWK